MKEQVKCILILLISLMTACTPSQKSGGKEATKEDIFNKLSSISLGSISKYEKLKLPKAKIRAFFSAKFAESNDFKNFKVLTKNEIDYYLVASGMREDKNTQFAVELEQKQDNLILQDFDKLYYSCIGEYCKECSFRFDDKGTINGCSCETLTEEPPQGRTACEHSIGIKSLEKD